jgi:L-fuconolactonase
MRPARAIDAHVHVACEDEPRFPRHPTGVGTEWWTTDGSVAQLRANLHANDVERAVIIQSTGLYAYDCRCAAAVVASDPHRFALITTLDMDSDDPAADIEAHTGLGAVGVRAASAALDAPPWLTDGRGAEVWATAERLGLSVVALVRTPHLEALGRLCRRSPAVPVVLDHCGMPHLDGPGADDAVLRAADVASLHMKVTSLNLGGGADAAWLRRLIDAYGSNRCCWGSDYPQHRTHSYAEMGALVEAAAVGLDPGQKADLFAATSLRLWWPGAGREPPRPA